MAKRLQQGNGQSLAEAFWHCVGRKGGVGATRSGVLTVAAGRSSSLSGLAIAGIIVVIGYVSQPFIVLGQPDFLNLSLVVVEEALSVTSDYCLEQVVAAKHKPLVGILVGEALVAASGRCGLVQYHAGKGCITVGTAQTGGAAIPEPSLLIVLGETIEPFLVVEAEVIGAYTVAKAPSCLEVVAETGAEFALGVGIEGLVGGVVGGSSR